MYHEQELTKEIIGAAIEVHRELGPGLLESAYEACLCYELRLRKHSMSTDKFRCQSCTKRCDWIADIESTYCRERSSRRRIEERRASY